MWKSCLSEKTIRLLGAGQEGRQAPKGGMQFITEMHTDAGNCRKVNQDACCVRMMTVAGHSLLMAAVCDGVGGMQEGDYASKSAIQSLNHWFDYAVGREIQSKNSGKLMDILQRGMEECIQAQNRIIYEYAREKGIRAGTTLTALFILDREYITAQVGDSRAYCMDVELNLRQLTEDQSVVAREVRAGRLSREEARHDKRRNIILQCIGGAEYLQVVYQAGNVGREAVFLLCSDGFVHELSDGEIKEWMKPGFFADRAAMKGRLMDAVSLVKARGEKDNITAVLVKAYGLSGA